MDFIFHRNDKLKKNHWNKTFVGAINKLLDVLLIHQKSSSEVSKNDLYRIHCGIKRLELQV